MAAPNPPYYVFVTYDEQINPLPHIQDCQNGELAENPLLNLDVKSLPRPAGGRGHVALLEQLMKNTTDLTETNAFIFTLLHEGDVAEYRGPNLIRILCHSCTIHLRSYAPSLKALLHGSRQTSRRVPQLALTSSDACWRTSGHVASCSECNEASSHQGFGARY